MQDCTFFNYDENIDLLVDECCAETIPDESGVKPRMSMQEMFLVKIGLVEIAECEGMSSSLLLRLLERIESSRTRICASVSPAITD